MSMSIHTQRRSKLIVTRDSIRNGGKEWVEVAKKLRVGATYTVSQIDVKENITFVWVHEIPGIKFNSVLFENVKSENPPTKLVSREAR